MTKAIEALVDDVTRKLGEITRLLDSPEWKGWVRLIAMHREVLRDADVMASPIAHDFQRLVLALAERAILKPEAIDAFLPLDRHLPKGAARVRYLKGQAKKREDKPGVDPQKDLGRNDRIRRHYARVKGEPDAMAQTHRAFPELTKRSIQRIVAKKK